MYHRTNFKRGEKLPKIMTAVIELETEGKVVNLRSVAKRIGRTPSTALMGTLWEMCDFGVLRATPHQHRGAIPVRWTFESVNGWLQESLLV